MADIFAMTKDFCDYLDRFLKKDFSAFFRIFFAKLSPSPSTSWAEQHYSQFYLSPAAPVGHPNMVSSTQFWKLKIDIHV